MHSLTSALDGGEWSVRPVLSPALYQLSYHGSFFATSFTQKTSLTIDLPEEDLDDS
jgi:hypothetical protein